MKQLSLTDSFEKHRKKTRKEQFLEDMDRIIPWQGLVDAITPFYPNPQGAGRRPIGIERMLRIYFLQHWFQLSDPAAEEAIYDARAMRRFVGIDLGTEPAPDETTICKFRHLMEKRNLGGQFFHLVNEYLKENGLKVNRGTIVDASIISAPSSTKNKKKQRDPDMRQTKKGNEWHFGMKMHIGVDDRDGLIHSIETTAANVHDLNAADQLLYGEEQRVWGDAGYTGIHKRDEFKDRDVDWRIALRPGTRSKLTDPLQEMLEGIKASVRAKVEHPFRTIKQQFGYGKVRYRGLAKNTNRLYVLSAFTNLLRAEKYQAL